MTINNALVPLAHTENTLQAVMLQTMLAILSSASKAQLQTPASAACLNWCTSCLWSSDYLLRQLAVAGMPVLMQGTVTAAEETSVPKLVQVGSADLSHDFCQGMLPHCQKRLPWWRCACVSDVAV